MGICSSSSENIITPIINGPKIIIKFPQNPSEQNMVTAFTKGRKQFKNTFLNLFLLPALTEAFSNLIESIRDNNYDEKVENLDWARIIDSNLNDPINSNDSPFELAQEFLQEMIEKNTGESGVVPIISSFNEMYK